MRKLPHSISIGGRRVSIRVVPDLEAWGEYRHDAAEIAIAAKTLKDEKILSETMRHEVMHAALDISGVGFIEGFPEEAVVRCFESIFFPAWENFLPKLKP